MSRDWAEAARRWVPRRVRHGVQRWISLTDVKLRRARENNPHADVLASDSNSYGSPWQVGIVHNAVQYHQHYVAACLEMGVPFKVLNLHGPDWIGVVRRSGCDVFLVWPDAHSSAANAAAKDRVEVMENTLGLPVFPTAREVWLYEDKVRTAYWLQATALPHPRTWVFHDLAPALDFSETCGLPIVFKGRVGAAATGVRMFHDRRRLRRWIRRVFRRGFVPSGYDRRDVQRGSLLLQEYVPGPTEWRLVRIGDSFFGHVKGVRGGRASGSGVVRWEVPSDRHLDFLEEVTEEAGFRSMDVDVFETRDGQLLINELQTVFGASHSVDQLRIEGRPGRFVRSGSSWQFEAGDFARNHCANERLRYVLEQWLPARVDARSSC